MDIAVKERLTGAIILIGLLVVIVPEIFSGRNVTEPASGGATPVDVDAGPPLRTYTMELNQGATARRADQSALVPQTPAAQVLAAQPPPQAVADPLPAAATPEPAAVSQPAPQPAPAEQPAASKPDAPVVKKTPVAPAAAPAPAKVDDAVRGGKWWVQLGSFSSRDNADRLVKQLRGRGYKIDQSVVRSGGKELYRVRAGPVASRAAAEELRSKLAAAGHKSTLVAP